MSSKIVTLVCTLVGNIFLTFFVIFILCVLIFLPKFNYCHTCPKLSFSIPYTALEQQRIEPAILNARHPGKHIFAAHHTEQTRTFDTHMQVLTPCRASTQLLHYHRALALTSAQKLPRILAFSTRDNRRRYYLPGVAPAPHSLIETSGEMLP